MLPSDKLDSHMGLPEAQESIAKVTFSVIPYIGPILNELFFEFPNRVKQNRVNKLVNILKRKIERIESQLVTKEYLLTEDFFDISSLVFENSTRIRTEERREALAKLYIISLQESIDFDISIYRIFVDFIVELKEMQIVILKYVQNYQDELLEIETYPNFIKKLHLESIISLITGISRTANTTGFPNSSIRILSKTASPELSPK